MKRKPTACRKQQIDGRSSVKVQQQMCEVHCVHCSTALNGRHAADGLVTYLILCPTVHTFVRCDYRLLQQMGKKGTRPEAGHLWLTPKYEKHSCWSPFASFCNLSKFAFTTFFTHVYYWCLWRFCFNFFKCTVVDQQGNNIQDSLMFNAHIYISLS